MEERDYLKTAGRLKTLGVTVRSAELDAIAAKHRSFVASGGNRRMRRAAARRSRRGG